MGDSRRLFKGQWIEEAELGLVDGLSNGTLQGTLKHVCNLSGKHLLPPFEKGWRDDVARSILSDLVDLNDW